MKRRIQWLALTVLGFAPACKTGNLSDMYGPPVMYAPATFSLQMKGVVTDKAGNPIPGIKVESSSGAAATTDAEGTFDLEDEAYDMSVGLRFTDPDGPANGGDFAPEEQTVEFSDEDWSGGVFRREDIRVELEERE